jgi:hypothetical protein
MQAVEEDEGQTPDKDHRRASQAQGHAEEAQEVAGSNATNAGLVGDGGINTSRAVGLNWLDATTLQRHRKIITRGPDTDLKSIEGVQP